MQYYSNTSNTNIFDMFTNFFNEEAGFAEAIGLTAEELCVLFEEKSNMQDKQILIQKFLYKKKFVEFAEQSPISLTV